MSSFMREVDDAFRRAIDIEVFNASVWSGPPVSSPCPDIIEWGGKSWRESWQNASLTRRAVVVVFPANVYSEWPFTLGNMQTLRPGTWLVDRVVDAFSTILASEARRRGVHQAILPCQVFKHLLTDTKGWTNMADKLLRETDTEVLLAANPTSTTTSPAPSPSTPAR